jgi:iron(III) transport system ATP-binding protein
MEPNSGRILYKKENIYGPVKKLVMGHPKIKLIHQNYDLFPNISLKENILYELRHYTKEYQDYKLNELLELVNLQDMGDKLPKQSSGGEQQRTAIAKALATEPDILLLDEPFANLDTFNKNELLHHFRKIVNKYKIGLLFVSHDAKDALAVADKVIVIKDGKIIQADNPYTIYNNPVSEYVAQITGEYIKLRPKDVELLLSKNCNKKKKYGIRPQHILLSHTAKDGFKMAKLRDYFYMGEYYKYNLELESRAMLYVKNVDIPKQDTFYVNIDEKNLIVL